MNNKSNSVTALQTNDGTRLGTFRVGTAPVDVAFEGDYVWVTNLYDSVTLIDLRQGI